MTIRVCAQPGCPELTEHTRCTTHTRATRRTREAGRPSTTERGYGTDHRKHRRRLEHDVEAGNTICARCGQPIHPGDEWDLDHTDDRTGYLGPSHSACNRATKQQQRQRQPNTETLG